MQMNRREKSFIEDRLTQAVISVRTEWIATQHEIEAAQRHNGLGYIRRRHALDRAQGASNHALRNYKNALRQFCAFILDGKVL